MAIAWLAISRLLIKRVPVDLNQGYWQMPLTASPQELFCATEESIHANANTPGSDECNLVFPGNA